MSPEDAGSEFLGPGDRVYVPARGGSWIKTFLPPLWETAHRVVAVESETVILLRSTVSYTYVKEELWRGPVDDLSVHRALGDRLVWVRIAGTRLRFQIDGKETCRRFLAAVGSE